MRLLVIAGLLSLVEGVGTALAVGVASHGVSLLGAGLVFGGGGLSAWVWCGHFYWIGVDYE